MKQFHSVLNKFATKFSISKSAIRIAGFLLLTLLLNMSVLAAPRYLVVSGSNWAINANWSATSGGAGGASFPVAGDDVFIDGARTVNIGSNAAAANVYIEAGSTLTSGTYSLTVSGNFTNKGTFTANAGTLNIGGVLTNTGTFNSNTGTVNFNGSSNQTIPSINYNNLSSTNNNRTLQSSGTIGISGSFSPGTGTYTISGSTVSFRAGANQNIPAFTFENLQTDNSGTKTITGAVTVTNVLTVGTSTTLALSTFTLSLSGVGTPLILSGTGALSSGTSTVIFNAASDQTIPALVYNNLQTAVSGTKTIAGTVQVNNIITIGLGTTLELGSQQLNLLAGNGINPLVINGTFSTSTSTVNYNGANGTIISAANYYNLTSTNNTRTFQNTGTIGIANTFTPGNKVYTYTNSTVSFNGVSNQTIPAFTYFNNLKTASSGIKTLGGTVQVNNIITVDLGTTLELGSQQLNLAAGNGINPLVINGTFSTSTSTVNYNGANGTIISAANYYNFTSTNNTRTFQNTGTIGIANTFTPGNQVYTYTNSTVSFNGVSNQTIPAFTYFNNLQTNISGTKSLGGGITVNNVLNVGASTTLELGSQTLTLSGSGTPLVIAGTFSATAGTSTVNYSNVGSTNVTALNYHNLNLSNGPRVLPNTGTAGIAGIFTPGAGAYTITGSTIHFNGSTAQTVPTFNYFNLDLTGLGTRTNGGTIGVANVFNPGSVTSIGGTVSFNGSTQNIPAISYNNLTIATAGTKSLTGNTSVGAVLNLTTGNLDAGSNLLTLTGTAPITGSGSFTASTSTVYYTNSGTVTLGALSYYNLDLTGGVNRTNTNISVANILTLGSVTTLAGTVSFNGSINQNIPALTYTNLQTATGGTKSLVGNTTVSSVLTVNAGSTIDLGSTILTLTGTPTPLVVIGNFVANTSTVIFSVNNPQTIPALTYYNLQTAVGNTKTLGGSVAVNNILTIGSGTTLSLGANTLTLNGTGTPIVGAGAFNIGTSSTVVYNGTSAQTIPTAYTFNNLTINNTAGVTLGASPTLNGILNFIGGRLNTGSNTLILGNGATVTGAAAGQYVNGNLRKGIAASTASKNFEIGDNNYYTPVLLNFTGTTNATGSILVKTTSGDHPEINNSELNPSLSANRYWTLTNTGVTFTSYSATFGFDAADVDGGALPASFNVNRYVPSTWYTPVLGTVGATSTQATGLAPTEFGDFQLGQAAPALSACGFNDNVSSGINFTPCITNIAVVNGNDSVVSNTFRANQYFTLNVIKGMIYQVYTSNVTNPASPLTISIYDEAFPANAAIAFSASNTGNGVTGANNVFVSFTSPISGRLRVLINKRRDCASTLPNTLLVRARIVGGSNTEDNPLVAGTDSWVGHIYDGTNSGSVYTNTFPNYLGNYNQTESFNETFIAGDDLSCNQKVNSAGSLRASFKNIDFSIRYRMNSTKRGLYIADIGSDDGSRLVVDGTLVYNDWAPQGYAPNNRVLMSLTGTSNLLLDFYEGGSGNQVSFLNFTQVLANQLNTNTSQSICQGNTVNTISGDVFPGTLPTGLSTAAYQWTYSLTPGGARTNITGATSATFTPSTLVAPFNVAGTYYIFRNARLTSVANNLFTPAASIVISNESNAATLTVVESAPTQSIVVNPVSLCYNNATQITLSSSNVGINYQLRDNATNLAIGAVVAGTGSALNFNTGSILTTTTYNVLAINPTTGCTRQMLNTNTVTINPRTEKTVTASPALVCVGNSSKVIIGLSQPNVKYVLRNDADNSSLGDTLTGNSGNLEFNIPVGYLVNSTVFNVWAVDTVSGCTGVLINKVTITIQNFPSPVFDLDQDFCTLGQGKVILATTDSTFNSFLWSNGDPTPSTVIEQSGFYALTVTDANGCRTTKSINIGEEKVINGDFSQGVGVGYTTGYILNQSAGGLQSPGIGHYAINSNANFTHSNFWGKDHTSKTGNFMIVNGKDGISIWQTTVSVLPNTRYFFSAWAMSVNNAAPFAQLQFNINGALAGTSPVLPAGVNNNSNAGWQRFYGTWDSGPISGNITIKIVNLQASSDGNDFGIDDVSFSTLPPVSFFGVSVGNGGNNLCLNDTLKLTASLTGGASPINYVWTGPNGFTSSDVNPVIFPGEGGMYYLTATEGRNCSSTDSIFIILSDPIVTGVTQEGKCSGNVRIALSGMVPNSVNNTIYYTLNNGPVKSASNIVSDALGKASFLDPLLGTTNHTNILRITGIFNGSCTKSFPTPPQVTLDIRSNSQSWIGGVSGKWNDPSNWCPGLPGSGTDVTIPTGVTVYVDGNEIANAKNLTLTGTAILELRNNATLNFYGDFSGTGKIDARRGIVATRRNNSNQNISGDFFVEKAVSTLVLANTGSTSRVTITGDTLKILSALEFENAVADLITSDKIVLVSSDTATASVGVIPGAGNVITGNFTVERLLIKGRKWRLLSAPTDRVGQTIKNSWQESGTHVPGYGFKALDTRSDWATRGFDAYGNNSSVKKFVPGTESWVAVDNTNALSINAESGYFVFVSGDFNTSFPNSNATKLRTFGKLFTGTRPKITVDSSKFAVIGNPYASRIDLRKVNFSNSVVASAVYVWVPTATGAYGLGAWRTLLKNAEGDYENFLEGTVNNFIESGQAFLVKGSADTSSITFEENDKSDGSTMSSFTAGASQSIRAILNLVPATGNPILLDGVKADFGENYSNNIDGFDIKKMGTLNESVSWKTKDSILVVDRRAMMVNNDTLHLNNSNYKVQNYQWQIVSDNLDYPGRTGFLVDRYSGTVTPLDMAGTTTIKFSVQNIAGSYAADRFKIVFNEVIAGPLPVNITNISANRNNDRTVTVQWKVQSEMDLINYEVQRSTDGRTFTSIITQTPQHNNGGSVNYQTVDRSVMTNDLFYRIKANSLSGLVQYSAIAKVGGFKTDALITVYPNPVQNKQMNVQFSAATVGNYQLTLLGNNGIKVLQQTLKLNNNTSTQTIELPTNMAAGRYQLQVQSPDGKLQQQSVIVL